jgi:hypothetical protein
MSTILLSFSIILLALLGLCLGVLIHGRPVNGRCCSGARCADSAACGGSCSGRQSGLDR